ncbi:FAD-binding oxidoreductase [Streptomyces sp. NPDC003077]|uniref:FAD-binding oxidoreductase n=1 Tax=Streptomyces sp. NPDC003077 TaxID=3154443 RepID=UPI0033B573CE
MHDRRPAVIARCRTTADVQAAVRLATKAGIPATVRGGGHNVAGTAVDDDTVMIDLSLMRAVSVNAGEQWADVDGGCLLKDLDTATAEHGLACPSGVVGHTGVAGLTLGGGYGWLTRKWGLSCDHIMSAEVVLADGSVIEATDAEHPDLMWALRGGEGTFGVVTRFRMRLRPVGPILYRTGLYSLDTAPAALLAFREFTARQSDDLRVFGSFQQAGTSAVIPSVLHGQQALELAVACSADNPDSVRQSREIYDAVPALATTEQTMPYARLQAMLDASGPAGRRYYTKSCYLTDLGPQAVEEVVKAAAANPSALSSIDVEFLRGAMVRETGGPSAFPQREAPYMLTAWASWLTPQDDATNIAWSRDTISALSSWHHQGHYGNYAPEDTATAPPADPRLARVKREYDPHHLFRGKRHSLPESARAAS